RRTITSPRSPSASVSARAKRSPSSSGNNVPPSPERVVGRSRSRPGVSQSQREYLNLIASISISA
ncbi:putative clip-associating protein 1-b, partial [Operophtera brumata]